MQETMQWSSFKLKNIIAEAKTSWCTSADKHYEINLWYITDIIDNYVEVLGISIYSLIYLYIHLTVCPVEWFHMVGIQRSETVCPTLHPAQWKRSDGTIRNEWTVMGLKQKKVGPYASGWAAITENN